jgi:hypothetical protein
MKLLVLQLSSCAVSGPCMPPLATHPTFEFPASATMQATYFCTDCCCRPLCGHCTTQHIGHRMIQVRARQLATASGSDGFITL